MFKYFTSTQYRQIYDELDLLSLMDDSTTHLRCQTVLSFLKKYEKDMAAVIKHAIAILRKVKLTAQKCCKILIFFHLVLQSNTSDPEPILQFLSYLINSCEGIIDKAIKAQQKQQHNFSYLISTSPLSEYNRSGSANRDKSKSTHTHKRATSQLQTKQDIICKQVYMMCNIVKPYLYFLQKIGGIYSWYNEMRSSWVKEISYETGWMILNFLKVMVAISNNFMSIGRYFIKNYGPLVILIAECLSKEINRFYPALKKLIRKNVREIHSTYYALINQYGQSYVDESFDVEGINELVNMLEEVAVTNERIYEMYAGKYFYKYLKHLMTPAWIELDDKDFEFIFHFWRNRFQKKEDKRVKEFELIKGKFSHMLKENQILQKRDAQEPQRDNKQQSQLEQDKEDKHQIFVTFRNRNPKNVR